jgi:hypothetical protein
LNIDDRYCLTLGTNRRVRISGKSEAAFMLDGFNKRDFAIFASALLLAGALTVGAVDFVIYHYVFQDTSAAPILAR